MFKQHFKGGMEKGGNRAPVPEKFREGGKPFILADRFAKLDFRAQMEVLRKLEEIRSGGGDAEGLLKAAENFVGEAEKIKTAEKAKKQKTQEREPETQEREPASAYVKEKEAGAMPPLVSSELEDFEEDVDARIDKSNEAKNELMENFFKAVGKKLEKTFPSGKHPAQKPRYKNIDRTTRKGEPPWWDVG